MFLAQDIKPPDNRSPIPNVIPVQFSSTSKFLWNPYNHFWVLKLIFNQKNHSILHNFCFVGPKIVKQQMCILPCLKFCLTIAKVEQEAPWFGRVITSKPTKGVCHTVALPLTLKSILRQKKNYGNLNISPCKNIIFQKSSERNQNPSRYYNSVTNLKFQHKPKFYLSK